MRIHGGGLVVEEDEVGAVVKDVSAWTVLGVICVLFPLSDLPYIRSSFLIQGECLQPFPYKLTRFVHVCFAPHLHFRLRLWLPPNHSLAQNPSFILTLRAHSAARRAEVSFVKQETCIADCEVKERVSARVSHSRISKQLTLEEMK